MKHNKALENQKFDIRLVNWNLKRGVITEKEYQEHLKNLPDESSKAKVLSVSLDDDNTSLN